MLAKISPTKISPTGTRLHISYRTRCGTVLMLVDRMIVVEAPFGLGRALETLCPACRGETRDDIFPMTYEFTVEQKSTYLHAIGTGARTEGNARRFLVDAYRASIKRRCGSLLLELKFSGRPLALASIYSVIAERSPDGAKLERIAYVDADYEHARDPTEFAELVAVNRGVNVRLFRSLGEAEHWLQSTDRLSDTRSAFSEMAPPEIPR